MKIDENLLADCPEYNAFVEKFKPKKTTDECYTPDEVYEAVREWAVEEYDLHEYEIVRPFYPGGDYENFDYPQNAVVLDNPPFSILSKICRFYEANKIRFFLFAPHLTLFSTAAGECHYVVAGARIRYKNGAVVNTSFVTNFGDYKIRTAPDLCAMIEKKRGKRDKKKSTLTYPKNCITSARLARTLTAGRIIKMSEDQVRFVRKLDESPKKSGLFGAGFIVSDGIANKLVYDRSSAERVDFSEREKNIIKELNKFD